MLSNKCIYALRAVFELSLRNAATPVRTQDIAAAQGIPQRFLEIILAELSHARIVYSRRGNNGGYALSRPPDQITVAEVIDCVQGHQRRFGFVGATSVTVGDHAFSEMWKKVTNAISGIYDNTTFADVVDQEAAKRKAYMPNYAI
jgi:Rrf2 family protein